MKKIIQRFVEIISALRRNETPAIDFEKLHNISEVAGYYVFPKWQPASILEIKTKIFTNNKRRLLIIWQELTELNPELATPPFRLETADNIYDAIVGVTSGYNIDDILYYQNKDGLDEEREALVDIFEAKYGVILGWQPSIPTLKRILKK